MSALPRVLLVDDEAELRNMLAAVLRADGFDCSAYPDAEAALRDVEGSDAPPDLVVTDAGLPGMDGFDLVLALEALHSGLGARTLVITGDDHRPRLTQLSAALGVRSLLKPFRMDVFLAACRSALDGDGPS